MLSKIIGGMLLIVGTSIGAGMLALPVATAAGGYLHSILLFVGAWVATIFAAFLILEVNLWLPEGTNLVSMAKATLGKIGQAVTWLCYLLLLYSLIAAYTAGGAQLLHNLLKWFGIKTLPAWDAVLFVLVLGAVVYKGIKVVDWTNRGLMTLKMGAYVFLVAFIVPHVQLKQLDFGHYQLLTSAVFVVVTSFGYATIIPSLRSYFNSRVNALRIAIFCGSLLSLLCYLLWDFVVQGSLPSVGQGGLISMAVSGHAADQLTRALSTKLHSQTISDLAHLFTSICITTSFLGVSLCLSDFLADGFQVVKAGLSGFMVALITFLPPLLVVLFYPGAFLVGLSFAGVFCVILLMLLPALMAYSGRYYRKIAKGYHVAGGRAALIMEIVLSAGLLIYGFWAVFS